MKLIIALLMCMLLVAPAIAEEATPELISAPISSDGDPLPTEEVVACTMEWDPLCGIDGETYGNQCNADAAGVEVAYGGECDTDGDTETALVVPDELRPETVCADLFGMPPRQVEGQIRTQHRLQAGYLHDHAHTLVLIAGMDALIQYSEGLGIDATELQAIRGEVEALEAELEGLVETPDAYKAKVAEIRDTIKEFRDAARAEALLVNNTDGLMGEIAAARNAKREELRAEIDSANAASKEIALKVFDLHTCLAENKINRFYNKGYDTTELDAGLRELNGLRDGYAAALGNGDRERQKEIKGEANEAWNGLRAMHLKKERVRIHREHQVARKRVSTALQKMEEQGVDTAQLRQNLVALDKHVITLQKKLAQGKLNETETAAVKARYQALTSNYAQRIANIAAPQAAKIREAVREENREAIAAAAKESAVQRAKLVRSTATNIAGKTDAKNTDDTGTEDAE